jgi:hypothetical protein
MPIDRDVLEAVREMDEHALRRLLMLAQARLEQRGIVFEARAPQVKILQRAVKCGKPNCTACPHGPYWYAYWWEDGRRRSRYLGKLDEIPELVGVDRTSEGSRSAPRALRSIGDG